MTPRRHAPICVDDEGHIECVCGQPDPADIDVYDPDDHEPMGGDPYWADLER